MLTVQMEEVLMAEPQREQRTTRRFALPLPLTVKFPQGEQKEAQARDVSARGISFFVDSTISEGSPIEFTLTLPPEITLTESIRVHCTGRVGGVEPPHPGRIGIDAVIERYEFLAET